MSQRKARYPPQGEQNFIFAKVCFLGISRSRNLPAETAKARRKPLRRALLA
jgi:hypothetical protein